MDLASQFFPLAVPSAPIVVNAPVPSHLGRWNDQDVACRHSADFAVVDSAVRDSVEAPHHANSELHAVSTRYPDEIGQPLGVPPASLAETERRG